MKSLASSLEMDFSAKDEFGLRKKLGAFQLFKKGSFRKITNLMSHDDGWLDTNFAIFDYQYTIQHGKSSTTWKQTVFLMDSKSLALPPFRIKPEHFFHRIGKYLNLVQDIEFEAHPEFSSQYLIQSDFPEMMKDIVSDDIAMFFTVEKKWTLEGLNYFLIFYRERKRLPIHTIEDFYLKGHKIVEMLKTSES